MWITLTAGIGAFTLVILFLVLLLLFAKSKLVQSGPVKIIINGDESNPWVVPAGSTLLTTLAEKSMCLPSAWGGGGTGALCTCTVDGGGG
ncbi:MAG: NADH:ubiquinone reductase (Na(+)-transporting) subunit F, partial [Bacteroidota bacterium]